MCEVALYIIQSKSAQIVAPNIYWETPQPQQLGYTTQYPVSARHSDSGLSWITVSIADSVVK